jgi:hypothetical protein
VRGLLVLDRNGGVLKLLDSGVGGPPERLRDLLARSQMEKVFEVFRSEEAALRSFAPPWCSVTATDADERI